jgi:hypothetical protein
MNKIKTIVISEEARYYNKSLTMAEAREKLSGIEIIHLGP